MTGLVGAMVSFEEGRELLGELAGVSITTKQVERAAEALGAEIADDERQHVHPVIDSEIPPTLYLGMDGTGVPIRQQELLGRAGKQADGSAKTREVKLCTLWSAEGRAPDGTPMRDEGSVTYSAAIESAAQRDVDKQPSAFAARVEREAKRRGFDRAGRQVVLGDGAPWIWNMADEYFPDAVQVVDLFHAKQHLSDVGKAIYGPTSELARQWGRQRHDELDEGRLDALLQALRTHTATHDEARKCVDYIERNRGRMRYTEFRAQGLCTSVWCRGSGLQGGHRAPASSAPACTGPSAGPTRSSPCAAPNSAAFEDFWERRSAARWLPDELISKICRAPSLFRVIS